MNSLISQDDKKWQSLLGNGNCLSIRSDDHGFHLDTALSSGIFADGHAAEVTWAQLVLDNAVVSHCVPDAVLHTTPLDYLNRPQ